MDYLREQKKQFRHFISMPFIYGVFLPVVVLDIIVEVYHRVAFWLYDLPYVERGQYVRVDRQKLSYLDAWQKFNCMYCGYVNGVFAYWVAIAGRTEQYWCGIKHEAGDGFIEPEHHSSFADYNDEEAFQKQYQD